MKTSVLRAGSWILSLLTCASCCTSALWENTDPNGRLWLDSKQITEAELQRRGIHHEIYTADWGQGYLVKKSSWHKLRDYNLRLLGTPVTLVLDAATAVAVVGVVMFANDPVGMCDLVGALVNGGGRSPPARGRGAPPRP